MDILIKNGTIVRATETFKGEILISDGKISKIADNIETDNNKIQIIDAAHKYIFPGGIDPHVHMNLRVNSGFSADDFFSGSKAALFGGTTTIIDFVTPQKGQLLNEALEMRLKEAENSLTDYSFHVSPIEWNKNSENQIQQIVNSGINSFKVYMAYDIGLNNKNLLRVLKSVAKTGGIVTVHAEKGKEIEGLRNKLFSENKTTPKFHAVSRPASTEYKAVKKIIKLAAKARCKLYIVHVSTKKSLKYIKTAQTKGFDVFAETCPQYLVLDDSKLTGEFSKTAAYVFSPPLRKPSDNKALWEALSDNTLQTVGTDHCPFNFAQKSFGKSDFRKIPNGAGGVEHRLNILFTFGVLNHEISLNKMVEVFSTAPAQIFGLYPQKGEIAVGSDADIVIWNPNTENIISVKNHYQNCDLNIYEGISVKGNVEIVILRGKIVIENSELKIPESKGMFISRFSTK